MTEKYILSFVLSKLRTPPVYIHQLINEGYRHAMLRVRNEIMVEHCKDCEHLVNEECTVNYSCLDE